MTYSVVVVDDQRVFTPDSYYLTQPLGHVAVFYYTTSATASAALFPFGADFTKLPPINELWLDHDLGGDDTTMGIVGTLEVEAHLDNPYPVKTIVLHSMNEPARRQMEVALRGVGYHVILTTPAAGKLTVRDDSFEGDPI